MSLVAHGAGRCLSPVSVVLSGWESLTPPGCDTSPIQVSSQQTLVLIYLPRKDGKLSWLRQKRRSHNYSNLGRSGIALGPWGQKAEILQLSQLYLVSKKGDHFCILQKKKLLTRDTINIRFLSILTPGYNSVGFSKFSSCWFVWCTKLLE